MKNFIFEFLRICIVIVLQVSVINALFAPIKYINLPITIILIFIFTGQYARSLNWSFIVGLLISLFTYNRFGIEAIIFLLISVILNILFNNFFSNASFVSIIILGLIAHFLNILILWFFHTMFHFIKIRGLYYDYNIDFKLIIYQMLANIIFITISYKIYLLYNSKIGRGSVYAR